MQEILKEHLVCPVCGKDAILVKKTMYKCATCHWDSLSESTVDISYKDPISSPLSNLFPHKFRFYMHGADAVNCISMESFIQSLRIKDAKLQKLVCETIPGYDAKKISLSLGDWRETGIVYWQGRPFVRESEFYDELITKAYDSLYDGNALFREIVLPRFKDKFLIHSIGKDNKAKTLLTEAEFRYQLNRLILRLDEDNEDEFHHCFLL